jgi:NAD(P) transhydrogenase subunit alpha
MPLLEILPLLAETGAKVAGPSPIALLTIFVMAIYVGVEVITKIPPTLHTPLMSGSNAISGITLIGAIFAAGQSDHLLLRILGSIAVGFAMINITGGFLVTHRMLGMFIKKK